MEANWFESDVALQAILKRQLGDAYGKAKARLSTMGQRASTDVAEWAQLADHQGPRLVSHNREGERIDEIEYHPAYRWMQQVGYGGGIVAATYDPALTPERGRRPKALTFALGYLFGQAESGQFCPICMTDGAARLVDKFGTAELKAEMIPRLAATDLSRLYTGAMFLTEREGGSDVGQCRTVATATGEKRFGAPVFKLTGNKWFCSNVDADVIMILARPEGAPAGTKGLGLFLLPKTLNGKRNGYRIDRIKDKLGVRSMPTGEVTLEGAEAYLLGAPGEGFHQMTEMLNLSRLYNAIASVAVMRRSLIEALGWAQSRVTFGKRLIEHPLMAESLLDLACEQRASLAWVFRCIELLDKADSGEASKEERALLRFLTPLTKYFTAKKAVWAASEGLEVLGGNGYIEDWPMSRVFRDAQVLPIWEGSTNVLVLDAFRAIRKEGAHEPFFAEVSDLIAEAPSALRERLTALTTELQTGLAQIASTGAPESMLRDWTDRACIVWQVAQLGSRKAGHGTPADLRAAQRVLGRNVPAQLLRSDAASADDVLQVAFG